MKAMRSKAGFLLQFACVVFIVALVVFAGINASNNLRASGSAAGFGFLAQVAGFDIAETFPLPWFRDGTLTWVEYRSEGSYLLALATGLANTLKVAVVGIVLSSAVGVLVALVASSKDSPLHLPAQFYIRIVRNVPLLLQLLIWYVLLLRILPEVSESLRVGSSVFLNNRGLFVPGPVIDAVGVFRFESPELVFGGRNIRGGLSLSPEYVALVTGLTLYTGSFIAELVRVALAAVPSGQREAASALGLSPLQSFRHVLLPQAVRIAVPPVVSQYLNLLKNSSLAVAIGYPELVGVGGTVINQSGQAIEVVLLWMAVYLFFSLLTSWFVNGWNARTLRIQGAA